jgi:hypothetical protein
MKRIVLIMMLSFTVAQSGFARSPDITTAERSEITSLLSLIDTRLDAQIPAEDYRSYGTFSDNKDGAIVKANERLLALGSRIIPELCRHLAQFGSRKHSSVVDTVIEELNDPNAVVDAALDGVLKTHEQYMQAYFVLGERYLGKRDVDNARIVKLLRSTAPGMLEMGLELAGNRTISVRTVAKFESERQIIDALIQISRSKPEIRVGIVGTIREILYKYQTVMSLYPDSSYGNSPSVSKPIADRSASGLKSNNICEVIAGELIRMLDADPSSMVRDAAASTLALLPSAYAAPGLTAHLHDPDLRVRTECALWNLDFPTAQQSVPVLRQIIFNRHQLAEAQLIAIEIGYRDPRGVFAPSLLEWGKTTNDLELQRGIAESLRSFPAIANESIPFLLGLMCSPDERVRANARSSIENLVAARPLNKEEQIRFDLASAAHFAQGGSPYSDGVLWVTGPVKTQAENFAASSASLWRDLTNVAGVQPSQKRN